MKKQRNIHGHRIEAAMEALSRILRDRVSDRKRAVRILEEVYRKHALQPIRGKAWPPDIWDKEMATLYVVAKYALAIHEEEPELFHSIFSVEETYEEAANVLLDKERSGEEKAKLVRFLLGGDVDSNSLARLMRVIATAALLGFRSYDDVEDLIRSVARVFPDQADTARKYARYYIALRTAEAIAKGEVRDRIAKEAFKQALAARLGLEKIIPDDEYIAYIARNVFSVPERRLKKVLSIEEASR